MTTYSVYHPIYTSRLARLMPPPSRSALPSSGLGSRGEAISRTNETLSRARGASRATDRKSEPRVVRTDREGEIRGTDMSGDDFPPGWWFECVRRWSRRRDSNPQPAHYKCAALPVELRRLIGGPFAYCSSRLTPMAKPFQRGPDVGGYPLVEPYPLAAGTPAFQLRSPALLRVPHLLQELP